MEGLLVSVAVVFAVEMGDKSQLMTLAFASRYPALPVLAGTLAATALIMALSVTVGAVVATAVPDRILGIAAGLTFLGFAAWTLFMGDDEPEETEAEETVLHARRRSRSAAVAAGSALFVAELGDKTMLAAATLAARYGAVQVWFGATIGMSAALLIAVVLGRGMAQRLPPRTTRLVAAGAFALFGVLLLLDAARG